MPDLTAYEIGEDGGRWLVVGQIEVHHETISVAEARLAVVALLREQLMPDNEDQFASEVLDVLDAPARVHEYPIYSDPKTELVYSRSPIGGMPIWGERLGTCAVALGFDLPDHRSVRREVAKATSTDPAWPCHYCGSHDHNTGWHVHVRTSSSEPRCTCAVSPNTGRRHWDDQCPVHHSTDSE